MLTAAHRRTYPRPTTAPLPAWGGHFNTDTQAPTYRVGDVKQRSSSWIRSRFRAQDGPLRLFAIGLLHVHNLAADTCLNVLAFNPGNVPIAPGLVAAVI